MRDIKERRTGFLFHFLLPSDRGKISHSSLANFSIVIESVYYFKATALLILYICIW